MTNVPPERLSLRKALILIRVRWQVELLFKLWKSLGQSDEWRTTKPWRILCEVYAKLLALLIQHWLFPFKYWSFPDRSLAKAAQTVRRLALIPIGWGAHPTRYIRFSRSASWSAHCPQP